MLFALFAPTVQAADFVDEINQQAHPAGQQVIYEMNVGGFTAEGTFAAAQQQLGELQRMGVDIVWLMPIYPRGGGINSPYAAVDFKQVNPAYGDVQSLSAFVAEAHRLGMKVWLDWVPNHMATNATWVTTHPEYFTTSGGQMIHPNGYGDVFELDYNNDALVAAMNDCLKYWINEADIDGYRCDYVSSGTIPTSYWNNTIPMLKGLKADKEITIMAESDLTDSNNTRLQGCGFDYDYAWEFQVKLAQFGASGTLANPLKIYCQDLLDKSAKMSTGRMLYITNHDQNYNEQEKTLSQKYGQNRYLLSVLAHTFYGMPLIYNGQEVGGNQVLNYFEDTKIDWNTVDKKMQNTLRTLNALKHSQTALQDKVVPQFLSTTNSNPSILAYKRTLGDSEVIVILNTATSAQTALIPGINGTYSLWLNSATIEEGISRKSYTFSGSLSVQVPAKGYLVYVKGNFRDEDISKPSEDPIDMEKLTCDDPYVIFYETPTDNATITAWMWAEGNGGESYTEGSHGWPGDLFQRYGVTNSGNVVYKFTFNKADDVPMPGWLIIEENGSRIYDGVGYVNHGYYVKGTNDPVRLIPTGIENVRFNSSKENNRIYNLAGMQVDDSYKGIVIKNGRKIMQ